MIYLLVLLLGVVAGLRAATPIAAISLAAYLGWLDFTVTWYSFLGSLPTVIILVILAIVELVGDQLPATPSRKVPTQFGTRVIMGAIAGALLLQGNWIVGAIIGAIGAVLGTLGGAEVRTRLARAFGRDLPAGLLEDAIAVVAALLIVYYAV
ncbi:DUF4126 family protein [uncultured Devosia sp.]|uniref:DUF4126 family protein n=1 Tax=uncultured Devosia sp. TaxID=211434 RepID=UPI0035C9BCB4